MDLSRGDKVGSPAAAELRPPGGRFTSPALRTAESNPRQALGEIWRVSPRRARGHRGQPDLASHDAAHVPSRDREGLTVAGPHGNPSLAQRRP